MEVDSLGLFASTLRGDYLLNSSFLYEEHTVGVRDVRVPGYKEFADPVGEALGDALVTDHAVLHCLTGEDVGLVVLGKLEDVLVPLHGCTHLLQLPFRQVVQLQREEGRGREGGRGGEGGER